MHERKYKILSCYSLQSAVRLEISVENMLDSILLHTAICAAGVTK